MSTKKKTYETFVIERHLGCPRQEVWAALLDLVGPDEIVEFDLGPWHLRERALSVEPPWRRVYEIVDGAPVALYQGTVALRDDGDECHMAWSVLADPLPGGRSDEFLTAARSAVERAVDAIASRCEP